MAELNDVSNDYIRQEISPGHDQNQLVLHSELDYLVYQGWNIKAAFEYYDPDRSIPQNERNRVVLGVEPFITPFVQASIFYTFNQGIPQNTSQNADELTVQLHLYF